jgi:Resolvase, N terminal domain
VEGRPRVLAGARGGLPRITVHHGSGRLLFVLFAAMAEIEREFIRDRTLDGLAAAEAQGKRGGRPRGRPRCPGPGQAYRKTGPSQAAHGRSPSPTGSENHCVPGPTLLYDMERSPAYVEMGLVRHCVNVLGCGPNLMVNSGERSTNVSNDLAAQSGIGTTRPGVDRPTYAHWGEGPGSKQQGRTRPAPHRHICPIDFQLDGPCQLASGVVDVRCHDVW